MAANAKSVSRSIVLDTTSAQYAVDQLNKKIDQYNSTLAKTGLTDKQRLDAEKKLGDAVKKRGDIQQQIEKGLGATYQQQSKFVSQLYNDLKKLPIASEEYKKKLDELKKAQGVFDEMKGKINAVDDAQKKMSSTKGFFSGVFWANMATQAIGTLKNMAKQSIDLALQAEGVKRAFDRINQPGLLDNLRKATKGTVSDLDLMKRAVQANNFQIPLEKLGTLLQFAQQRARETGESVDYLVESIVTGIARKSPLILDNLGINIQRINAEFQNTKDFAKAAMNVVNEELEKAGPALDTTADKVDRLKAGWNNFWTSAGGIAIDVIDGITDSFDSMTAAFEGVEGAKRRAAKISNQKIAEENEKARKEELNKINTYSNQLAKVDLEGREKIIAQVQSEVAKLVTAESNASVRGEKDLQRSLNLRLDLWRKFYSSLSTQQKTGDTLAGLEAEISTLQDLQKNASLDEYRKYQTEIDKIQKKINDATGKTAEDAANKAKQISDRARQERKQLLADLKAIEEEFNKSNVPQSFLNFYEAAKKLFEQEEKLSEALKQGKITTAEYNKAWQEVNATYSNVIGNLTKPLPNNANLLLNESALAAKELPQKLAATLEATPKAVVDLPITFSSELTPEEKKAMDDKLQRWMAEFKKNQEDLEKLDEAQQRAKSELTNAIASDLQTLLDGIDQRATQRENAELKRDQQINDSKKANLQKQLNSKLISQKQYENAVAKIDKEMDAKKEAIDRKQFERHKKLQIAQAIINGANAITQIFATVPKVIPGTIIPNPEFPIALATAIATSALQIGVIAAQKFAKGGKVEPLKNGRINAPQNIPTQPNGDNVLATVRTGEVILNEEQQRRLGGPAIFRRLGVPGFADGGKIEPFWKTRPYFKIDSSIVKARFADGGVVGGAVNNNEPQVIVQNVITPDQEQLMKAMLNYLQNPVPPELSLHKIDQAYDQRSRIQQDAQFK